MAKKNINFTTQRAGKKMREYGTINDVVFLYVKIDNPQENTYKGQTKTLYEASVVVDCDTADDFIERFPATKKVKYVPMDWFEEIFKVDPEDIPFEPVSCAPTRFLNGTSEAQKAKYKRKSMDCFCVLSFSTNALVPNKRMADFFNDTRGKRDPEVEVGDLIPDFADIRPKTFVPDPDSRGKVLDRTDTKVGNGSTGKLMFSVAEISGEEHQYLYQILVEKLVKYSDGGPRKATSGFGQVSDEEDEEEEFEYVGFDADNSDEDEEEEPVRKPRRPKRQPQPEPEEDDEEFEEEEIPEVPKRTRKPAATKKPAKRPARKPEPEPEEEDEEDLTSPEFDDDDLPWD